MWIQLDEDVLERTHKILQRHGELAAAQRIRNYLGTAAANRKLHDQYRAAAQSRLSADDEVDQDAVVSLGDDPGAYVMCWLWVAEADLAGRTPVRAPGQLPISIADVH